MDPTDIVPPADVMQEAGAPTLLERFQKNADEAFYNGTVAGGIRGATTEDFEKRKVNDRYDALPQWETPLEGGVALAGQIWGGIQSPENFVPVGLGARALETIGVKSAGYMARFFAGAVDASIVNSVSDAAIQQIEIAHGQRDNFDGGELAASVALGALLGGAGNVVTHGTAPRVPGETPALGEALDRAARVRRGLPKAETAPKVDVPASAATIAEASGAAPEVLAAAPTGKLEGQLGRDVAGVAGTEGAATDFTRVADISGKLADALDAAAVRQGRISKARAAGTFNTRSGVIRVKNVDDFDVLTHELGHHMEQQIGKPLQDLMKAHANELEPMAYAGADPTVKLEEGFAEFMRTYVTNPAYAERTAPGFHAAFKEVMGSNHGEALAALDDAAKAWRKWLDKPSADAVATGIVSNRKPAFMAGPRDQMGKLGLKGAIADYLSRSYTALLDDLNPLHKAVQGLVRIHGENTGKPLALKAIDDTYKLARMARGAYQHGHADIMYGVHGYRETGPASSSLRDAIVMAHKGGNSLWKTDDEVMRRFGAYLWSRRALGEWDRFDKGLIPNAPDKLSRGDHAQNVKEMESAFPHFKDAAALVHDFARALWTKKRDAGLITPEQWAEGLKIKDYVPGLRAFDQPGDVVKGGGKGGSGKAGFVKRFKGSTRDVINPLEALVQDAYKTADAIARNDVARSLDRLAWLAGPGGGAIAERVPAKEMKALVVDPLEAMDKAAKASGLDMTDWQPLRDEIESLLGGDPVTMFRSGIASERGEPIIFFRDGGKLQALRLADGKFGRDMLQAMTMLQRGPQGLWVNMLGRAGALLRTGITSSPPFILANFVRDQVSSMVMYGKPFKRLTATFGGMASELFQRDAARRYTAAGGVMGGANTAAFHDMHIRADLRRLGRKGFMAQRATWKGVLEMTELSETGMRSGLFKTFREEAMKRGLDDIEATFEAAWRARDHIDFNRRGSAMAAVSRVVPFLNASLQGLDKFQRHFLLPFFTDTGEPAARALAVKSWARLSALMAAGMGLHALMSEHEEYLDLDARTRASHWAVKLGDRWLFIPKPFEMAAFLNLAEAGYDAMARQDPRWKEWFMSSLYEVSMPPNVMQGNPAVKTAYEYATGRDLSTGSDIVPDQYKGLEPWLQHTAKTSSLSEAIGKVFNVSPLMVDHMIVSFGGSMGRDLLSGYDYALSDKPLPGWDEFAMTRRFIKDGSRNARSTRAFWDLVGSRTGLLENARRSYQEMIDAGDPAAAAEFLSSQSSMAQDWIAAGSLPADARRIHPLTRAQSAVKAINDLRRDIAKGQITTANGTVEVNRVERGAADDILEDMAAMEGRNALVLMGVPGWETRQLLDPAGYERELAATSPGLAQALADRYASGHVLPFGKMQKLWPVLQQRIRRDGSAAPVSDLAAAVRAARPEMGGQKLQTRKRAVVPGDVP